MHLSSLNVCSASALLAVASHVGFKNHEPTVSQFLTFAAALQSIPIILWRSQPSSGRLGLWFVAVTFNLYFFTILGASISIYRLFLHPLRKYPGPTLGKLSKFHYAYICATGKSHRYLEALHQKHGDIVRYGPNELSFIDAEDVTYIYGARSLKLRRGPWYDGNPGRAGAHTLVMASTRNVEAHKVRRRIWDKAFTAVALESYEPRLIRLTDKLIRQCEAKDGSVFDISAEVDHFTFDAMGDLGFSSDFGLIDRSNKESLEWTHLLHSYMRMAVTVRPVPWFKELYKWLPIDRERKKNAFRFVRFTNRRFEARYARGQGPNEDIFDYLMQADSQTGTALTMSQVAEESIVVVIAGSDTSSVAITFVFYYLMLNPDKYKKLQAEIDSLWDGTSDLTGQQVVPARAPYLNAVINESIRLAHPDPHGNQRSTPQEGAVINGKYIAGFTQISVHKWTMLRNEKNFSRSLEFIPERWMDLEREKLGLRNNNTKAWIPFGAGIYSCAGKPLATLEMRLFLTRFLKRLEIVPRPGFDLERFPFDVVSTLTLMKVPLPVVLKKRNLAQ
jgi:cytochrome P450